MRTNLSLKLFSLLQGIPQLPCAKALYNYEGKEPGDLKFSKGDIIILRRQVDENWYHGEVNGVHGFFPTNFVQIIKPLPQPPPQCKALYDFEVKDKEADKDCLPFAKVTLGQCCLPLAAPSLCLDAQTTAQVLCKNILWFYVRYLTVLLKISAGSLLGVTESVILCIDRSLGKIILVAALCGIIFVFRA